MRPAYLIMLIAALQAYPAASREINITDTRAWLSMVAEASIAAKACDYEINSNKVLGEMLATYDSMDSFIGEYFGDELDRQEMALKRDRAGFCHRAWDKFGVAGSDFKSLLLPGRR